jgi:glycosyltransferase involved in cell wall biosynthesis
MRSPIAFARLAWGIAKTNIGLLLASLCFRPTHILIPEFRSVLLNAPTLALLRVVGTKVVVWVHNPPPADNFYRMVWRWGVSPYANFFVACSNHSRRELVGIGIPSDKVMRIYNTAPTRRNGTVILKISRDRNKVIFVGQVVPQKGLDMLLEAIALVSATHSKINLDVVGKIDGWVSPEYVGYRERLLARASSPDLAGRVRFLGSREDVPDLLAGAAVHCAPSPPSMREGLPLVNLEAKSAGTPSVVFPIGPFPELVVHQVDGWICSDVSVRALAEGISYFLSNPERAEKAGQAARLSAELFSRERFIEAWKDVFQLSP